MSSNNSTIKSDSSESSSRPTSRSKTSRSRESSLGDTMGSRSSSASRTGRSHRRSLSATRRSRSRSRSAERTTRSSSHGRRDMTLPSHNFIDPNDTSFNFLATKYYKSPGPAYNVDSASKSILSRSAVCAIPREDRLKHFGGSSISPGPGAYHAKNGIFYFICLYV